MTAVATLQQSGFSRNGYSNVTTNGNSNVNQLNLNAMTADEISRMFVPRKSMQRTNSSSSQSSQSSTSTIVSPAPNSIGIQQNGEVNFGTRKKPARGLWPSSKAEPVSGLSTATASGPSTPTSATNYTNGSASMTSQHIPPSTQQANTNLRNKPPQQDLAAVLYLLPMNGTFERKTITVPYGPDILRIGRQTNQKTVPTPINGYFDSKVLSRQHAEVWAERDGLIWIRDVKSSNGTFVNGKRLSQENRDSEPQQLKEQDVLELGIDIVSEDQKTVVHHKVAARVELAGVYASNLQAPGFNISEIMDAPQDNSHFQQQGGQMTRNRGSSQGSVLSNGRYVPAYPGGIPVYQTKWLQPVTMEQIVKRLNTELKSARNQSQTLHHTGNYVEAVLIKEDPAAQSLAQKEKISSPSKSTDAKSRFASEPTAPPPTQPLPEKPDNGPQKLQDWQVLQPLLRRTDTERPKPSLSNGVLSSSEDGGSNIRLSTLAEALDTAQREIANQTDKLKEMESALRREREARTFAEEQVSQLKLVDDTLESDHSKNINSVNDTMMVPSVLEKLQSMRIEMSSMETKLEQYRQRAESAEKDSKRDRKTLAEMVEGIQKRESGTSLVKKRSIPRKAVGSGAIADKRKDVHADGASDDIDEEHAMIRGGAVDTEEHRDRIHEILSRRLSRHNTITKHDPTGKGTSSSNPFTDDEINELSSAISTAVSAFSPRQGEDGAVVYKSRAQEQLAQSVPYVSMLSVVLLGVGMMAYLNGWQKIFAMFLLRRSASRAISSATSTSSFTVTSRSLSSLRPSHAALLRNAQRPSALSVLKRSYATEHDEDQPEGALKSASETISNAADTAKGYASSAAGSVTQGFESVAAQTSNNESRSKSTNTSEGEPNNNLYVGNLYFEITVDELRATFAKYGTVEDAKIIFDPRGMSKGFGYVRFEDTEGATAARDALNYSVLEGRKMTVQFAARREARPRRDSSEFQTGPRNPPSKTLFIGNMSYEMTDKDLNELFRETKNVLDVRVAIDRRTGQPRGFAHADFTDTESAVAAGDYLRGREFYGRSLRIDYSTNKPNTTPITREDVE